MYCRWKLFWAEAYGAPAEKLKIFILKFQYYKPNIETQSSLGMGKQWFSWQHVSSNMPRCAQTLIYENEASTVCSCCNVSHLTLFFPQATAEQIRLAQVIYDKNDADFEDKVKQVMSLCICTCIEQFILRMTSIPSLVLGHLDPHYVTWLYLMLCVSVLHSHSWLR